MLLQIAYYIRYYLGKIRHYPDYTPINHYQDFIMVDEKQIVNDFRHHY